MLMPKMDGIEATRQINESLPETKVIIFSIYTKKEYILNVLDAGAKGYVLKDSDEDKLLLAIKTVHNGSYYLDSSIANQVLPDYFEGKIKRELKKQSNPLTDREKEVLMLLAQGYKKKEIAQRLSISSGTVENHRANMFRKTEVKEQTGLIKYAARIGLIDLNKWAKELLPL